MTPVLITGFPRKNKKIEVIFDSSLFILFCFYEHSYPSFNIFHLSLSYRTMLLEFLTLNITTEYFRFWSKNKEVEIELHNDELPSLKMPNMFHLAEIFSFMYLKNVFFRDILAKFLDFHSRVRIQNVTDLFSERIIEAFPCDKTPLSLRKVFY